MSSLLNDTISLYRHSKGHFEIRKEIYETATLLDKTQTFGTASAAYRICLRHFCEMRQEIKTIAESENYSKLIGDEIAFLRDHAKFYSYGHSIQESAVLIEQELRPPLNQGRGVAYCKIL